jgi:hypothetical protein
MQDIHPVNDIIKELKKLYLVYTLDISLQVDGLKSQKIVYFDAITLIQDSG